MQYRLWIPERAVAQKETIPKEEKCETCLGSGEEEHRYLKQFGYSHIPCKVCRGLGRKKIKRLMEIVKE